MASIDELETMMRDIIRKNDPDQLSMILDEIEKTVMNGWSIDMPADNLSNVQAMIDQMEDFIELHAYTWDEYLPSDESVTWIEDVLKCISQLYRIIATSSFRLFNKGLSMCYCNGQLQANGQI
jgi:hypothetical protein